MCHYGRLWVANPQVQPLASFWTSYGPWRVVNPLALVLPGSRVLMRTWRSTKRDRVGKESGFSCNEAPEVQDQIANSPEEAAGSHAASGTVWAKQGR